MPSAIVGAASMATGRPGGQRGRIRGGALRLHPDHPHVGPQRLHREGDAGREPAAADADDDRAHLGALLQDLQPDRALPGDDVRVVEGVDEDRARSPRAYSCAAASVSSTTVPCRTHLGAVVPGRRDLRQRGADRHEHRGPHAEQRGGERDALRVVAGAGRDDPGRPLLGRQPRDPHVRAAQLERTGALEVLALEVDRARRPARQVSAALHRGRPRHSRQHLLRAEDVVEDQGVRGAGRPKLMTQVSQFTAGRPLGVHARRLRRFSQVWAAPVRAGRAAYSVPHQPTPARESPGHAPSSGHDFRRSTPASSMPSSTRWPSSPGGQSRPGSAVSARSATRWTAPPICCSTA